MTNLLDDKATDKLVQNISGSFAVLCDEISNKVAKHLDRISASSWVQAANVHGKVNKVRGPFKDNAILSAIIVSLGKQAGVHGLTAPEDIEKAVVKEFEQLRSIAAIRHTALDDINRNFEHEDKLLKPIQLPHDNHDSLFCRTCIAFKAL